MALDYGSSGAASSADDRAGARVDVDLHALTIAGGDLDLPDDHAPGGVVVEFDDDPGRVFHRGVNDLRERHRGALDPLEMFGFDGLLLRELGRASCRERCVTEETAAQVRHKCRA